MQNAFLCNLFNIVQSCFKLFCFLLKAFGMMLQQSSRGKVLQTPLLRSFKNHDTSLKCTITQLLEIKMVLIMEKDGKTW